ncbi:MAG TPA: metal-dependent hydrolase [Gemmatimonadota bacterium]|nr:metal-dependent hydrolase [Gemmatimonadota bacterium]
MDNVSHSLAGWALARGAGPDRPAGTTLALVLANNLPDIDVLLIARSDPSYLFYHRGITHSLLGLAVLPLILAVGLWWGYGRRRGLGWYCLLAYCGVALHLLYDVVTPWGTMLLYPFDLNRFALEWLFIVDPVTWVLPILVLVAAWRWPARARTCAAAMIVLLGAYGGTSALLHAAAERAVNRAETSDGREVVEVYAFPRFGAPLRWNGVAIAPPRAPEPRIARYSLSGIPPATHFTDRFDRGFDDPWVRRALVTPAGQGYLWWARVPFATTVAAPAGTAAGSGDTVVTVALQDLRFTRTLVPTMETWTPYAVRFRFDPATGELLEIGW